MVELKFMLARIKWHKFCFCVLVRRLFLKVFSMEEINCMQEGYFEIAKLDFTFKTKHCISERVVPKKFTISFWFITGKPVGWIVSFAMQKDENFFHLMN